MLLQLLSCNLSSFHVFELFLSDRIYILNGSPGQIREEIVIREKKPRSGDFNLTESFLKVKREILQKL